MTLSSTKSHVPALNWNFTSHHDDRNMNMGIWEGIWKGRPDARVYSQRITSKASCSIPCAFNKCLPFSVCGRPHTMLWQNDSQPKIFAKVDCDQYKPYDRQQFGNDVNQTFILLMKTKMNARSWLLFHQPLPRRRRLQQCKQMHIWVALSILSRVIWTPAEVEMQINWC